MTLLTEYRGARHDEEVARLRRVFALRAMLATGMSQRQVAEALGITQPAVSQQLRHAPDPSSLHPAVALEAAAPVLETVAAERGYQRLAVFGSVARGEAGQDSDIDLLVEAPVGTSSLDFVRFQQLVEKVLGRKVDLVEYGGLDDRLDADIHEDVSRSPCVIRAQRRSR